MSVLDKMFGIQIKTVGTSTIIFYDQLCLSVYDIKDKNVQNLYLVGVLLIVTVGLIMI